MDMAPRPSRKRVVDCSTHRPSACAQSAHFSSYGRTSLTGLLGSTGITPLPRYYEPIRLPARPAGGYVFPPAVEAWGLTQPGLPGSSADLSARAVPNHPGRPGDRFGSLTDRRWQASPSLAGWPPPLSVTRPKRVHLRYGSRVRSAGLRRRGSLRSPPASLPVERAINRATSFQVARSTRLSLAHQRRKGTKAQGCNP
jgi:hypothetical protein